MGFLKGNRNMSDLIYKDDIQIVERNIRGAWVIYGAAGVRQYYGYTKAKSIALYKKECKKHYVVFKKPPKKPKSVKYRHAQA